MLFGRGKAATAAVDGKAVRPVATAKMTVPPPAVAAEAPAMSDAKPEFKALGRALELSKENLARIAERQQQRKLQDFAKIVSLMAHEPKYQDMSIKDLQQLVMPAVASGQYLIAETKPTPGNPAGTVAGALLWAMVSPDIAAKFDGAGDLPLMLQPADWASGETVRVIARFGRKASQMGLDAELAKLLTSSASHP